MTRLDKLIELEKKLQKLNRKNRLEDKLKQQEYYDEIKELFDPLSKTLNRNNEQTLRAINWHNQELDKQTKAIQEVVSQIGENASWIQEIWFTDQRDMEEVPRN